MIYVSQIIMLYTLTYTVLCIHYISIKLEEKYLLVKKKNALLLLLLLSHISRVRLCVTPWTAAYQAPLSTGFSRREYWSGLPLPSLGEHYNG